MGQKCDKVDTSEETEMECIVQDGMPNEGSTDIFEIMKAGDLERFRAALETVNNIDHRYESQNDETLLEHACREDRGGQVVAELLQQGARAEGRNALLGCSALHIAAGCCNKNALLVLRQRSDPNVLNLCGDNVLHVLCRKPPDDKAAAECVAAVLQIPAEQAIPLDVNHLNMQGHTPVYLAAYKKNVLVVRLLIEHGCSIDSDDVVGEDGKRRSARHLLQEWTEFQQGLPDERPFSRSLVFLLYYKEEDAFVERLRAEAEADPSRGFLRAHDGRLTLLQVAVEKRLARAAEALLQLGADPNETLPGVPTASQNAAYRGFPEILRHLIDKGGLDGDGRHGELSALHWLIKGAKVPALRTRAPPDSHDYEQCLEQLLSHKEILNAPDVNGRTPLHYAISHRVPGFVDRLVDNGALLGLRDKNGSTLLDIISPADLQKFLDSRIKLSDPEELIQKLTFDMRFLEYFDNDKVNQYNCQPLVLISKCKEQRCVLTHPLVECFLHMKWKAISSFYACFLLVYLIFAILLVSGIILDEYHSPENTSFVENATLDSRKIDDSPIYLQILNICLWGFLTIITVLTIFYYCVSWDSLQSVKRCLLKGVIGILTILFLLEIGREHWRVVISNFVILLSSAELVLLMGDHPKLTAYVKMWKTVTWNFLKFFLWFSPLLLAFVSCFALLFRDASKMLLHNLSFWFFRSFVMVTGEYEAGELMKIAATPLLSHVVFMMFVFFLAVVLFNLLNALAVNDTIIINEDTELFVNISRINLLHHAEIILTFLHKKCRKENTHGSSCLCGKVVRPIEKCMQALSLKNVLFDGKIIFELNKKNKWKMESPSSKSITMDTRIIKAAANIKRSENADVRDLLQDLMRKNKK